MPCLVYGMNTYTTNLVKQLPGEAALDDFRGNVEFTFTGPNGNPPNLGYQAESFWLQSGIAGFRAEHKPV